jgi:polyhydroxybutyrate depolymerase
MFIVLAVLLLAPGDHTIALHHGGLQRSYIVHVPAPTGKPLPAVINMHGGGGNAAGQQKYTQMDRLADREHFVVIYPNGAGRGTRFLTWNAGTCCAYSTAHQIDDVGFIRAVVEDVARRTPLDRSRVYATGLSNGSMMAYRLAAEASDLVAAIAPVAGSMVLVRFHPTLPVPVMHFHSVDDPRALYNGGLGPPFPATSTRVDHPPVEQQLAKWIAHDGCRTTATVEKRLIGKGQDAGNTAAKLVYAPCSSGANVVLWKLSGSGHVWPGRNAWLTRMLGKPTHLIDANEEMWAFFHSAAPRAAVR